MDLLPELKQSLIKRIRLSSVVMAPISTGMVPCLTPLPALRAVLFDIYGTLMISAAGEVGTILRQAPEQLAESALQAAGYRLTPGVGPIVMERYCAAITATHLRLRNAGISRPEVKISEIWGDVVESLQRECRIEGPLDSSSILALAVEYEIRQNPVWLMPGAIETLAHLRRKGILLGIVSNAQFYTPLMVEALTGHTLQELGFCPDLCVWSYEQGEAKPSTALWQNGIHRLTSRYGIPADQILAVGNDTTNDIAPPKFLGCRTALFAGDARSLRLSTSPDSTHTPDLVITELQQLTTISPSPDQGAI